MSGNAHGVSAEDLAQYGHLSVEQYLNAKMEAQVRCAVFFDHMEIQIPNLTTAWPTGDAARFCSTQLYCLARRTQMEALKQHSETRIAELTQLAAEQKQQLRSTIATAASSNARA